MNANDAERAVLGAILSSGRRNLDDLHLRTEDFYQPQTAAVFDAIQRVIKSGNRPDAVTVRLALGADPAFREVNPELFLVNLIEACPMVMNADHYADLVTEAADRRGWWDHTETIRQMVAEGVDPATISERARKFLDQAPRRGGTSSRTWDEVDPRVIDYVERGARRGIPTPWPDMNRHLGGLVGSRMYTIAARPGEGKALALDTPLPTPTGWTTMGEVQIGDYLIGADGRPTRVVATTDVMRDRPCYRVRFNDSSEIVADGSHQWVTMTRRARQGRGEFESVKTTEQIADTLLVGSEQRLNHSVRVCDGWQLKPQELALDPYILGLWLGDGSSGGAQITTADPEIVDSIRAAGLPCRKLLGKYLWSLSAGRNGGQPAPFLTALRELGVVNNKHIPETYLRSSYDQRLALMQGLIDTDGYISARTGRVYFEVCSERLARGAFELALSLGWVPSWWEKPVQGRTDDSSTCYRVSFMADAPAARLPRKRACQKMTRRLTGRFITEVTPIPSVPVRCVQVDAEDHLYLAGPSCIATHNSLMAQAIGVHAAVRHNVPVLFASLEMSAIDLGVRIYADRAGVPLSALLAEDTAPSHWASLAEAREQLQGMGLHVNDNPYQSMSDIRAEARSIPGLGLVIIDYLQLVQAAAGTKRQDRREQVDQIARDCKLLAKELDVPVVTLAQMNRNNQQRADKRPILADLRESGAIEQDSDIVILMQLDQETADLTAYVEKNRHGPKGPVYLQMRGHYARITQADGKAA